MNLQCASRGLCLDGNGISHLCRWLCLMRESASSFQTLIISIWHAPSPFRTLSHPIALRPLTCGWLCMQALRVGFDLVRLWLAVRPSRCSSAPAPAPARLGSGSEVSSDDAWLAEAMAVAELPGNRSVAQLDILRCFFTKDGYKAGSLILASSEDARQLPSVASIRCCATEHARVPAKVC